MGETSKELLLFSVIFVQVNGCVSALYCLFSMFLWLIDNFCIVSDGTSVMFTNFCGNQFESSIRSVSGYLVIICGEVSAIGLVAGKMCLTRLFLNLCKYQDRSVRESKVSCSFKSASVTELLIYFMKLSESFYLLSTDFLYTFFSRL